MKKTLQLFLTMCTGLLLLTTTACKKKEGCTDPSAINYDASAEKDNGSCEYPSKPSDETDFSLTFDANGNSHKNPGITADQLVPVNDLGNGTAPTDAWFESVTYKGAFGTTDWTKGWTLYDGYQPTPGANVVGVSGTIASQGETINWTANNTYLLDGFCFVNNGATLNIEAGTVIKAKTGQGENASALIVARGGKIYAEGTAQSPIVFTFETDALDGTTDVETRGQWGGVILLGDAKLNSSPGETSIEGIPTNEPRGLYGGSNDAHDGGVISYVSIRHGGTDIGAGNEINGLTLGGVGSATQIDHVEIISNADDGIEFFGGKPRTKYMLMAYCGDDCFDYDEGFRGFGQFWAGIQAAGTGDRGGEHDGGTDPETGIPYAIPFVYNATYFGNGDGRAVTFRDNAGGHYFNSVFVNWAKGIDIEDLASGEDSYARFKADDLSLTGNVFWDVAAGAKSYELFTISQP